VDLTDWLIVFSAALAAFLVIWLVALIAWGLAGAPVLYIRDRAKADATVSSLDILDSTEQIEEINLEEAEGVQYFSQSPLYQGLSSKAHFSTPAYNSVNSNPMNLESLDVATPDQLTYFSKIDRMRENV
jgi:hypothetical protein